MMRTHETLGRLPPWLNVVGLPANEQMNTAEFMGYVGEIWSAVLTFRSALTLFNFSSNQLPLHFEHDKALFEQQTNWKLLAAREGVWSIYNVGMTMRYAISESKRLPTLRNLADHSKLESAQKKFDSAFHDYCQIRNAIAHIPATTKSPTKRAKNYYKGPFKSDGEIVAGNETLVMVKNSLDANRYQTTFKGRLLSYEISARTLEILVSLKDEFFSGFDRVEEETMKASSHKS